MSASKRQKQSLEGIIDSIILRNVDEEYQTLPTNSSKALQSCFHEQKPEVKDLRAFAAQNDVNGRKIQTIYTMNTIYSKFNLALASEVSADKGLNAEQRNVVVYMAVLLGDVIHHQNQELPDQVYRGASCSQSLLNEYRDKIGNTIYHYGFTSTSRNESVAMHFAKDTDGKVATFFTINLMKGQRDAVADVQEVSEYKDEEEILIACNSGFRVDNVQQDGSTAKIELTLCDQSGCPTLYYENPFRDDTRFMRPSEMPASHPFASKLGVKCAIINVNSGKALNLEAGSETNGANIHQWNNPESEHSKWLIKSLGAGDYDQKWYTITNVKSGKALNVKDGSKENGANIHQWDNLDSVHSKWTFHDMGGGAFALRNVHSGKFLNVDGGSKANGANVQQWNNPQSGHSQWKLVKP